MAGATEPVATGAATIFDTDAVDAELSVGPARIAKPLAKDRCGMLDLNGNFPCFGTPIAG
jgi:hypothetical protein